METFVAVILAWTPTLVLAAITGAIVWVDPRRMRCAIFLGLTVVSAYLTIQSYFVDWLTSLAPTAATWVIGAFVMLVSVVVIAVSVFLIWAGIVLVLREGPSLAHSLSLALGLGIVAYVVVAFVAFAEDALLMGLYLLLLVFPIFTFGFVLFSYLLYSGLYGFWAKRFARPGQVVVVLGSGLIGEQVPPLLARRLDLGMAMYEKSLAIWPDPLLVVSGGKGHDEQISEAEGMSRYVLEQGMPQREGAIATLVKEDRSVSTEQNIAFTRAIAAQQEKTGPWMAVTSDFHAFRAAMLLSEQRIAGNAVGARSVRYFWASAKLRELIAILASRPRWTVAAAIISTLPLAGAVLIRALAIFGVGVG